MERYRVSRRKEQVQFITEALELSGCTIEKHPDPKSAPFLYSVVMPTGEPLDLICYAFLANKYGQENRPQDEHRFQVKYGSDFKRFHSLHVPSEPQEVTLFFGVHLQERILVALDPAMHNPTWFSKSVEFKTSHVEEIHRTQWCGWERDRSEARRKNRDLDNFQTETLLGFAPEKFARYVFLERAATGISPGERLLLIESDQPSFFDDRHELERELDLPISEILDMIENAKRLKVAVRGRAAEKHLGRLLAQEQELESYLELDEDGQPDFVVRHAGHDYRIECKNTLRRMTRGVPKVDFQKTRASKNDPCSRYYRHEQFEILAACLHPITGNWEFKFCATRALSPHKRCREHLSPTVLVQGESWSDSLVDVLRALADLETS